MKDGNYESHLSIAATDLKAQCFSKCGFAKYHRDELLIRQNLSVVWC